MDTQTQIDRLIELAIIQRSELKQLVEQLPQLREHLNAEVEKVFEETEPQLRSELEEWTTKQTADKTAALGVALEAKIANLAKSLEISTQARYSAIIAEREENARLAAQAEAKIAEHAASLPSAVKEIVSAELARFPRAGEIDQLRKEFAEPRGLNPRGKWQAGETYNRLDLVTYNGDSFVSNIDGNTEKPSRNAANWTLNAARGAYGGGGGITSLNDVLNAPTSGQIIGSQNGQYVPKTLVAGANITINETASSITIIGDEGQISLQDGTAAAPSLFFTNDTDTGLYRPAANTLGVAVGGAQVAYFDANGITTVGAGATFDGSVHAANGNANNPSLSFTGDDNTGFFRHQPDEIGITLGGTQKATLTSTTFSITPNLSTSGNLTVSGTGTSSFAGPVTGTSSTNGYQWTLTGSGIGGPSIALDATNATVANRYSGLTLYSGGTFQWGLQLRAGDGKFHIYDGVRGADALTVDIGPLSGVAGTTTVGGNLTVSGTGGITSSSISPLLKATSSALGSVPKLTLENTNLGAWNVYLSGTDGGDFKIDQDSTNKFRIAYGTGNTTLAGSLTVSGTGNSSFAGNIRLPWSTPSLLSYYDATYSLGFVFDSATRKLVLRAQSADAAANQKGTIAFESGATPSEIARFAPSTGNLLLKSDGVDSANGKLQLATHTTSAGGIGFGTDTTLYRESTGTVVISSTGTAPTLRLAESGTFKVQLASVSGTGYLDANQSLILRTNVSTTALTLDTSQNATFAGTIKPQQAATASAPTYVKGAIYFDTTLNKLRVGGATGWETITSV